jgi:hypothetical protein
MKRFLLVLALGVMVLASAAPARAQLGGWPDLSRPSYRDEARQPYYEARRIAYDNGYREGLKEGEKDGRKRDNFEFRDEGAWRDGDKGYRRSMGNREGYRQMFRSGFEAGYAEAYRRYAPTYGYRSGRAVQRRTPAPYRTYPNRAPGDYRYPGGSPYPGDRYGYSPAHANGVQDGYEKGLEDARDRDSYDPARHKWYRSADHDYRREYGPKDQYRDLYRQGFREGYDRGYRVERSRR